MTSWGRSNPVPLLGGAGGIWGVRDVRVQEPLVRRVSRSVAIAIGIVR